MDPFTEFVVLVALVIGVPAYFLRLLCRTIEHKIASLAPPLTGRRRYLLVQVIPAKPVVPEHAENWWPRDTWQA